MLHHSYTRAGQAQHLESCKNEAVCLYKDGYVKQVPVFERRNVSRFTFYQLLM